MTSENDIIRLCPNCREQIFKRDEGRGVCPHCGQRLLTLGGEPDESPIAGDPDVGGKPDDFYDRGDDVHSDVW